MRIIKALRNTIRNRPVYNYFNTEYSRNALIVYVVEPFRAKNVSRRHSNLLEAVSIAKVFSSLGYNIDIYNHDYILSIDKNKYDVVFGMGDLYEKLVKNRNISCSYIYYATGSSFYFQNIQELNRIARVAKSKQVYLTPKRLVICPKFYALTYSDAIVLIGNEVTKHSYDLVDVPIHLLSQSVRKNEVKIIRDTNQARKNYLWFGSHGSLHKGLDLCLDYFVSNPEFHLHVCGYLDPDFERLFSDKLQLDNVHVYGFVDIESPTFTRLVNTCLFTILPSCSEGESGSLLNTMLQGLIPITTYESGIDIDEYGYVIKNVDDVISLHAAFQHISDTSDSELNLQSESCTDYVKNNFSIDKFENNFVTILHQILGVRNG